MTFRRGEPPVFLHARYKYKYDRDDILKRNVLPDSILVTGG